MLLVRPTCTAGAWQLPQGEDSLLNCKFCGTFTSTFRDTMYHIRKEKRPNRAETPIEHQRLLRCAAWALCDMGQGCLEQRLRVWTGNGCNDTGRPGQLGHWVWEL